MKILSTYKTKILHYNHIFEASVQAYRDAVSFFIDVCLKQWGMISVCSYQNEKKALIEKLTIPTQRRPSVIYNFPEADARFHKFPSYHTAGLKNDGKVIDLMRFGWTVTHDYKCDYVMYQYIPGKTDNQNLINYCHKRGIKVCFYNISTVNAVKRLKSIGVDMMILNKPIFIR